MSRLLAEHSTNSQRCMNQTWAQNVYCLEQMTMSTLHVSVRKLYGAVYIQTYLCSSLVSIGWLSKCEHFPQCHPVAPNITGVGELAVVYAFWGIPVAQYKKTRHRFSLILIFMIYAILKTVLLMYTHSVRLNIYRQKCCNSFLYDCWIMLFSKLFQYHSFISQLKQ